jgi:S1-C subfamily serine protease
MRQDVTRRTLPHAVTHGFVDTASRRANLPAMRVTAALLLASATLAAMPARANEEVRFRVVNRTGEIAVGLYAAVPGQEARNLIAGRAMRPGQTAEVTRRAGGCIVDLRLVTAGGAVHDRPGTDVCATPEIRIGTAAPAQAPVQARVQEQVQAQPAELVAAVQRLLASLGFDAGPADGMMGPRTQSAIAAFQRERGLPPTGLLDGPTIAALRAASPASNAQAPDGKPPPIAPAPRQGAAAVAGKPPPARGADRPEPIQGGVAVVPPQGQRPQQAPQDPFAQRPMQRASTGTGFVVAEGRLLTNQHVIGNCRAVNGLFAGNRRMPLTVIAADAERDLALLSGPRDAAPVLAFREGPPRRGDEVVTYGFPLTGILGSGPTLTTGDVSALTGLRDDPNTFIISAPVQSGNSGGPLLDRSGNVLGVIVAKLNAQRVAERTGDLPQNVNIAIHGRVAIDFLRRNGVTPRTAASAGTRPAAEVGEIAHPSTVLIECMR